MFPRFVVTPRVTALAYVAKTHLQGEKPRTHYDRKQPIYRCSSEEVQPDPIYMNINHLSDGTALLSNLEREAATRRRSSRRSSGGGGIAIASSSDDDPWNEGAQRLSMEQRQDEILASAHYIIM